MLGIFSAVTLTHFSSMPQTRTIVQFNRLLSAKSHLRSITRDLALRAMALNRHIESSTNWVRFPFYHHVFEDERRGFTKQLNFLSRYGDFIDLEDAIGMLVSGQPIDGRYFCITFDDGLSSCSWGAAPILVEKGIPAAFYIVANMVGKALEPGDPTARDIFGFKGKNTTLDFMTWADIRDLANSGFTIGSHTLNHLRLLDLQENDARTEMAESKATIEHYLQAECRHFCPPYGIPNTDFDPTRDATLAKKLGYVSLVTGQRGANQRNADPFGIRRDHLLANWGLHQVRYFFSLI